MLGLDFVAGGLDGDVPGVEHVDGGVDVFGFEEADVEVEEEVVGALLGAVAVEFDAGAVVAFFLGVVATVHVVVGVEGVIGFFAHEDDVGGGETAEGFGPIADVFVGEVIVEEIGVGLDGSGVGGAEHDGGGVFGDIVNGRIGEVVEFEDVHGPAFPFIHVGAAFGGEHVAAPGIGIHEKFLADLTEVGLALDALGLGAGLVAGGGEDCNEYCDDTDDN